MGGIISWYSFNSPVEVYPVWPTVLAVNVREQLGRPVDCRYARLLRIKNDGPKNVEDSGQWVWRRCSAPVGPGRDKSGPAVSSDHQDGAVEGRQTGVGRGFSYFFVLQSLTIPDKESVELNEELIKVIRDMDGVTSSLTLAQFQEKISHLDFTEQFEENSETANT